jgi:predicted metal-dependent enzyme (double-stranded beta helix superfamily)
MRKDDLMEQVDERNSLEQYVTDIRTVWGNGEDPELPLRVKTLMETLLTSTRPDEFWMAYLLKQGKPAKELYRDPDHGFVQMAHVHQPGHKNTPHDHGPCWVVYGVYRGEIEIAMYRRTDDGAEPGKATLETKEIHRLTPGVAYPYLSAEIHSTRAIEAPAVVFRFLSCDIEKVRRQRYNPERGTVAFEEGTPVPVPPA